MTIGQATDLLWMLCGFDAFDLLFTDRRLGAAKAADLLATTAERTLCR